MWLRRDKQAFSGEQHTLAVARKRQARGNAPPTLITRARLAVTAGTEAGVPLWHARPRRRRPVGQVVYLHGGGYVHPLTPDYWRLVRALAAAPAEVTVPAYPLAPDATVDEVLPRLLALVVAARQRDPELPLVLMGDSAGGALALVLARRLAAEHGAPPDGVVLLSPWLDATLGQPDVPDLEPTDPMLAESGLRAAGRCWAGGRDPADPLVSPVADDLAGLPPVTVLIGRRDILRPAVDALADLVRAGGAARGARLHVEEVTAMFHVWMTRAIPEARRTRRLLRHLLASGPPYLPASASRRSSGT